MEINLDIKPVGFSGEQVTKWQATIKIKEADKTTRAIQGNPATTEADALESLETECSRWLERAREAKLLIKLWRNENDPEGKLVKEVKKEKAKSKKQSKTK